MFPTKNRKKFGCIAQFPKDVLFRATFQVNVETASIQKGGAIPVKFNEAYAIINNVTEPIESLIMGISAQKNVLDTEIGAMPRSPGH